MIKNNLKQLIITSIVILLPIVIGLILWNQLPEQIPTHWDIHGNVDNWSSKPFAVVCIPILMLVLQWVCIFAASKDPKHQNYHPKPLTFALWICPTVSLLLCTMVYGAALGYSIQIEIIMPLFMGVLFIVIGNLLPKCRQTYTMGIRLPWTLASEDNWNKTHRFTGKVWLIGGLAIMATTLWKPFWLMMGVLVIMVVSPVVYSYLYYRNHEEK